VVGRSLTEVQGRAPRGHWPEVGQGVVEYGLILSLSALLAIVLLVVFGATLSAFLQAVGDAIDAAT
jgi:Flp pilus assembly pilin Flp